MRIAYIGQKGIGIGEKGGGIENHVLSLARELSTRGHEITVYVRGRYAVDQRHVPRGVRLRPLPTIYRKNIETFLHTFFCTWDALIRRYDIIHYHGVGPATLSWIPRLFRPDIRVVVTFHSQDRFHQKWGFLARHYLHLGEWAACWFPHVTIAVSHVIQVYARNVYRRQVIYIPNGAVIEAVEEREALERFGLKPKQYVLNVSRLIPHKGQGYLIEAFQRLKGLEGFKLVIVGAPVYTSRYEQELRDLAAGNPDVIFTGFQDWQTLRQLYAHAYLYVQPSESEGLSVAVLEAMSFGTPPLVSDIPENIEVIHRSGFTFRNKDVEDLTTRLQGLLHHPGMVQEASGKVRDVVKNFFSWPAVAERLEAVYRSVRH